MDSAYLSSIVLFLSLVGLVALVVVSKRWKNLFLTLASLCLTLLMFDLFFLFKERVLDDALTTRRIAGEVERAEERSTAPGVALEDSEDASQKPPPKAGKKVYSYRKMDRPFTLKDSVFGYIATPSLLTYESSTYGEIEVYEDVLYISDEKGRRVYPPPRDADPKRHALFFGGSYTYGEGLTNAQMLSSRVQENSDYEFQGYNYALKGYGTSQMYCQLQKDDLFDDVTPKYGIAVYGFISDHIFRTTGKPLQLEIAPLLPLFRLDDDGKLDGPFHYEDRDMYRAYMEAYRTGRSTSPLLKNILGKDAIRFMSDEEAVKTTAAVIAESKRKYGERFDGEFYVLIWPRRRLNEKLESLFVSELDKAGVNVLRVPRSPYGDAEVLHPIDNHPSAKEIDWIAHRLLERLAFETAPAGS